MKQFINNISLAYKVVAKPEKYIISVQNEVSKQGPGLFYCFLIPLLISGELSAGIKYLLIDGLKIYFLVISILIITKACFFLFMFYSFNYELKSEKISAKSLIYGFTYSFVWPCFASILIGIIILPFGSLGQILFGLPITICSFWLTYISIKEIVGLEIDNTERKRAISNKFILIVIVLSVLGGYLNLSLIEHVVLNVL